MVRYQVTLNGKVDADSNADAARKLAAHFAAIAQVWDGEADWDAIPQTFAAPTLLDIKPAT